MVRVVPDHDHERIRAAGRDDDTVRRAAELLQAIADPARLALVELISQGEVCVAELVAATGANESTGKHIYYTLADDHVRELVDAVLDHVDHLHADATRRTTDLPTTDTRSTPTRSSQKGTS
jgi:ArsR family transcriptional regulator